MENKQENQACCEMDDIVDSIRKGLPKEDLLIALAESFKVFGDSSRIKLIFALQRDEMCVNHLAEAVGMGQSAVSHQLRILRSAKLVKTRREGKNIYYSLDDEHVQGIIKLGLEHVSEQGNTILGGEDN